jgi:spore germination cell wall hydrolase CwlJ-like protein
MTRRLLPAAFLCAATSCVPAAQGQPLIRAGGAPAAALPAAYPASPKLPLVLTGLMDWAPPTNSSAKGRSRSQYPAAVPFIAPERAPASAGRALACLTAAVYHEARSESGEGQRAVAQVVLNRARHYAFPSSICGVVYQGSGRRTGCQFTFTCDGSLGRPRDEEAWRRAEVVARQALDGHVEAQVSWATHYHAGYVRPYWSRSLAKVRAIGGHVFYRLPGDAGEAAAFVRRSSSLEPAAFGRDEAAAPAEARNLALAAAPAAQIDATPGETPPDVDPEVQELSPTEG